METILKTENGELIHGDNIEVLKTYADNTFDNCISDFPYNLSFMGKKWDNQKNFYSWCYQRAIELHRVIKSGGYVLIFGHHKSNHRMKCAFEDAGFNIVEEIDWVYGCLSEDTEILTNNGWKKYNEINYNDLVMSWNSEKDIFEFNNIDNINIKPYKGEMIKFKNDDTDQLLTPNHRVYKKSMTRKMENGVRESKFEDDWNVEYAENINRYSPINFPLSSCYEGMGIGGEKYAELLGWIWSEGGYDNIGYGVRITQSSVNINEVNSIKELFEKLNITHKLYTRERIYKDRIYIEYTWFISGEYAKKIRKDLINKKLTYEFIFKMTLKEKESFLKTAELGDGSKNGTCIYQNDIEQLEILQTMYHLIGYQSRINYNKKCVEYRRSSTTQLQCRHLKKDYKQQYNGIVWCVTVKNSAFLARRNNRLFITGNSGFPKNQDIGKMFDKKAGVERQIVGKRNRNYHAEYKTIDANNQNGWGGNDGLKNMRFEEITEPSTDLAKEWNGWKTSGLKPAKEIITVFQKPLEGKYLDNIEKYNCGAMNIDVCRVPTSQADKDMINAKASKNPTTNYSDKDEKIYGAYEKDMSMPANELGRFPSNVIFDDSMGKILDNQSGITQSGKANGNAKIGVESKTQITPLRRGNLIPRYDEGGASRYFLNINFEDEDFIPFLYCPKTTKKEKGEGNIHVTVKPKKLIKWLIKLVTPKNGITLDITSGSGTHGLSCEELNKEENYNLKWVDIEINNTEKEPYCNIAKNRINTYLKNN